MLHLIQFKGGLLPKRSGNRGRKSSRLSLFGLLFVAIKPMQNCPKWDGVMGRNWQ